MDDTVLECPICFEMLIKSVTLDCGHSYHNKCILKLDKCPECEKPINKEHIIPNYFANGIMEYIMNYKRCVPDPPPSPVSSEELEVAVAISLGFGDML